MTYVNEKFTTPLHPKRKILLPRSIYDQQQFITSFFFDVVDNDEYEYIIFTFPRPSLSCRRRRHPSSPSPSRALSAQLKRFGL